MNPYSCTLFPSFSFYLTFISNLARYLSFFFSITGMLKNIILIFLIGLLAWAYQAALPPPPKICGSPGGPAITASRIKLRDGRHLAYKEHGVSRQVANYKIIFIHGFGSTRHDAIIGTHMSPVLTRKLQICFVCLFVLRQ